MILNKAGSLRHAAEALSQKRSTTTVELPSGVQVRLHTRPVQGDGWVAGGVVDAKVLGSGDTHVGPAGTTMLLPGLVGTGTLWRRACLEAESAHRAGGWLALAGEAGTGKLALLRALHSRVDPTGHFHVIDAAEAQGRADAPWLAEARRVLDEETGTVVLRHLEQLHDVPLRVLAAAVQAASQRQGAWLAIAVPEEAPRAELARLLRLFPTTVHVPPLRHHVEDVEQLVPHLLQRLGQGARLSCSSEAMQVLLRATWPGNVRQLADVLRHVLRQRRTGVVQAAELPPEVQSLSRRRLSPLESMERDAIALGLQDAGGNKAQAARALGMSRATIYRKIHDYGISVPASV